MATHLLMFCFKHYTVILSGLDKMTCSIRFFCLFLVFNLFFIVVRVVVLKVFSFMLKILSWYYFAFQKRPKLFNGAYYLIRFMLF